MADIELIVKMPEEKYKWIKENNPKADKNSFIGIIVHGTPLPKGHGRLIDVDEVIKIANKTKDLHGAIWNAQTIIEAESEE